MYKKNFSQGKGSRFGAGSRDGGARKPMVMHKTTCSKCGKACEVPFRPTGEKPVYCRECFAEMGGGEPRNNDRAPRRDFDTRFDNRNAGRNDRVESRFERKAEVKSESNDELKKQLEGVNNKLDKLIYLAENIMKGAAPAEEVKKAKKKGPSKR